MHSYFFKIIAEANPFLTKPHNTHGLTAHCGNVNSKQEKRIECLTSVLFHK